MSASPPPGNGARQVVLQVLEQARVVPLVTLRMRMPQARSARPSLLPGCRLPRWLSALRRRVKPSAGWQVIPGCWSEPGP